jgi:hypothetical protein
MKTTIDIPEGELKELIRHTKAGSKKEAVVRAVEEFNRLRRLEALAGILGTFEEFMTLEELREMREDRRGWKKAR